MTISRTHRPLRDGADGRQSARTRCAVPFEQHIDTAATVLHVDDEPDFAEMTKLFLERIDDELTIITEHSAIEAIETVESTSIDAIISDYQMPRMDGIEFLEAVRADHPDLPFILCTARGSEEIASEAIASGVTDYIQKKTDTDQYEVLANRLTNAIDRHRVRRRLVETTAWSTQLMEQSLAGVYIVQDGRFAYVNEYFADLFGYEPGELIDESPSVLTLDDAAGLAGTTCLESIPAGTHSARYQSRGRTGSGAPIAFDVEVSTIAYYGAPAALGVVTRTDEGER